MQAVIVLKSYEFFSWESALTVFLSLCPLSHSAALIDPPSLSTASCCFFYFFIYFFSSPPKHGRLHLGRVGGSARPLRRRSRRRHQSRVNGSRAHFQGPGQSERRSHQTRETREKPQQLMLMCPVFFDSLSSHRVPRTQTVQGLAVIQNAHRTAVVSQN